MERKRLTRQESRLMTQAMLIDAAERVFLRNGFENASVEQITVEAGFSRGAFYSNFIDKDDLALAVIDKRRREMATTLRSFQRMSDPSKQLKAFREWFIQQWRQRDWIMLRAELTRRAQRNPEMNRRLMEFCRDEIHTIAQCFPLPINVPQVTAVALLGVAVGIGSLDCTDSPEIESLCEAAIRLLFDRLALAGPNSA